MSLSKTTKSYSYRSVGGGNADINVEYAADLSNLSRLEVRNSIIFSINFHCKKYLITERVIELHSGPYLKISFAKKGPSVQ